MKEKEKSYLFFENALVTWVLSEIETWKWRDFETLWTKFKFFHADCSFLLPCRVCAYDITQIFHGDFCSNLGARAMCWNYALISSGGLDKKKCVIWRAWKTFIGRCFHLTIRCVLLECMAVSKYSHVWNLCDYAGDFSWLNWIRHNVPPKIAINIVLNIYLMLSHATSWKARTRYILALSSDFVEAEKIFVCVVVVEVPRRKIQ